MKTVVEATVWGAELQNLKFKEFTRLARQKAQEKNIPTISSARWERERVALLRPVCT